MITDRGLNIRAALRDRQLVGEINLCRYRAFGNRLGSAHSSRPTSVEVAQLAAQNFTHRRLGQLVLEDH